jgi:hypothetical protein
MRIPSATQPGDRLVAFTDGRAFELVDGEWQQLTLADDPES